MRLAHAFYRLVHAPRHSGICEALPMKESRERLRISLAALHFEIASGTRGRRGEDCRRAFHFGIALFGDANSENRITEFACQFSGQPFPVPPSELLEQLDDGLPVPCRTVQTNHARQQRFLIWELQSRLQKRREAFDFLFPRARLHRGGRAGAVFLHGVDKLLQLLVGGFQLRRDDRRLAHQIARDVEARLVQPVVRDVGVRVLEEGPQLNLEFHAIDSRIREPGEARPALRHALYGRFGKMDHHVVAEIAERVGVVAPRRVLVFVDRREQRRQRIAQRAFLLEGRAYDAPGALVGRFLERFSIMLAQALLGKTRRALYARFDNRRRRIVVPDAFEHKAHHAAQRRENGRPAFLKLRHAFMQAVPVWRFVASHIMHPVLKYPSWRDRTTRRNPVQTRSPSRRTYPPAGPSMP